MIASLNELWRTGRFVVEHPVAIVEPDEQTLVDWIVAAELEYRAQLPSNPPKVDCFCAVWAMKQFVRASQLMVHRELGEQFIQSGLEAEPADVALRISNLNRTEYASIHYSVDLTFRFLPDLERLTKAASQTDPLLNHIALWADRWPLSFARTLRAKIELEKMEPILQNRCLRILYIERALGPNPTSVETDYWAKTHDQYEWKSFAIQP